MLCTRMYRAISILLLLECTLEQASANIICRKLFTLPEHLLWLILLPKPVHRVEDLHFPLGEQQFSLSFVSCANGETYQHALNNRKMLKLCSSHSAKADLILLLNLAALIIRHLILNKSERREKCQNQLNRGQSYSCLIRMTKNRKKEIVRERKCEGRSCVYDIGSWLKEKS